MANKKNKKANTIPKLAITLLVLVLYIIWLQFFGSIELSILNFLIHIIFLFILIYIYHQDIVKGINEIRKKPMGKKIFAIFLFTLLFFVVGTVFGGIIRNIISDYDTGTNQLYLLFPKVPWGTLFVCFSTIFFYPIVETLVFQKSLKDVINNKFVFIILAAVLNLFFQVQNNPSISEVLKASPVVIMSIVSSIIYLKKENIMYVIYARMAYNLLICLIQLIGLLGWGSIWWVYLKDYLIQLIC